MTPRYGKRPIRLIDRRNLPSFKKDNDKRSTLKPTRGERPWRPEWSCEKTGLLSHSAGATEDIDHTFSLLRPVRRKPIPQFSQEWICDREVRTSGIGYTENRESKSLMSKPKDNKIKVPTVTINPKPPTDYTPAPFGYGRTSLTKNRKEVRKRK